MSNREKPVASDEEKAFYAGFEAAKRWPVRNDVVKLYKEYQQDANSKKSRL